MNESPGRHEALRPRNLFQSMNLIMPQAPDICEAQRRGVNGYPGRSHQPVDRIVNGVLVLALDCFLYQLRAPFVRLRALIVRGARLRSLLQLEYMKPEIGLNDR